MKTKESGVYGYLRRFCLASALTAGLAMVAGGSPAWRNQWILTQSLGTQKSSRN